jgi:hypothetical protein
MSAIGKVEPGGQNISDAIEHIVNGAQEQAKSRPKKGYTISIWQLPPPTPSSCCSAV